MDIIHTYNYYFIKKVVMPKYVAYSKVKQVYDISPQTAKNWAIKGNILYKAIQNDTRKTWLYDIDSIGEYIENTNKKEEKDLSQPVTIIYCRVSSKKQEADLIRQINLLTSRFPEAEVIKDIGSGLNYNRHGFSRLVERICRNEISNIVVTYKDRLMRFGNELFEKLCEEHNCKILVHSQEFTSDSHEQEQRSETKELQEDLLSIVNIFVARRNGKRSGQLRKERNKEENKASIVTNETS